MRLANEPLAQWRKIKRPFIHQHQYRGVDLIQSKAVIFNFYSCFLSFHPPSMPELNHHLRLTFTQAWRLPNLAVWDPQRVEGTVFKTALRSTKHILVVNVWENDSSGFLKSQNGGYDSCQHTSNCRVFMTLKTNLWSESVQIFTESFTFEYF